MLNTTIHTELFYVHIVLRHIWNQLIHRSTNNAPLIFGIGLSMSNTDAQIFKNPPPPSILVLIRTKSLSLWHFSITLLINPGRSEHTIFGIHVFNDFCCFFFETIQLFDQFKNAVQFMIFLLDHHKGNFLNNFLRSSCQPDMTEQNLSL